MIQSEADIMTVFHCPVLVMTCTYRHVMGVMTQRQSHPDASLAHYHTCTALLHMRCLIVPYILLYCITINYTYTAAAPQYTEGYQ